MSPFQERYDSKKEYYAMTFMTYVFKARGKNKITVFPDLIYFLMMYMVNRFTKPPVLLDHDENNEFRAYRDIVTIDSKITLEIWELEKDKARNNERLT